jgi:hypothetical protein
LVVLVDAGRGRAAAVSRHDGFRERDGFGLGVEAASPPAAAVLLADDVVAAGRVVVDAHGGSFGWGHI